MDAGSFSEQPSGRTIKVRCCIVGGGPAGMMLGYLLGRAGIDVVVLEKHADFFRDFRGDTVHPSTLQVMDELGLIDGFLKLPHQRLQKMDGMFGGTSVRIADLSRLKVKYPFIAFMPQWDFLNFLRESGKRFASLKVMMNAEATDLIQDGDRDRRACRAKTPEGTIDIEADLTIACDGRHSIVRERAGLAGRGDRRADGCAVVSRRQARQRNRKRVRARRSRQDDGDVRSRRLLAMRLCHRQGPIRRGEGEGAAGACSTTSRGMAPILKSGHVGRQELGRRQAADGGDQSPEALDACRDCSASAMPRMRCRRSAASASTSRFRMRSRPPICWRQSLSTVARRRTNWMRCGGAASFRCG